MMAGNEERRYMTGQAAAIVAVAVAVGGGVVLMAAQEPAVSKVVAPGAQVEKLAGDFIFTEGPTSDNDGNVYFVDQDNNRIMKYDTAGQLTTFMQPSGYSNGMSFDGHGHLIATADEKNEMWSIDVATKQHTVLFNSYDGKLLNGPNDVWVQPTTGRLYFTDPYYARKWWNRGPKESPETVYMYAPDTKTLTRIIDDLVQPNGIIGTPDGKTLYVADIRGRTTFKYDINADGTVSNKTLFAESGSDGVTIDSEGNLYLTSGRAVQVYDRAGQHLESIAVPEVPSNVCFGGRDKQTLFITARTGFYAVKMRVHGVGPQ
jgi:gluconolactonase